MSSIVKNECFTDEEKRLIVKDLTIVPNVFNGKKSTNAEPYVIFEKIENLVILPMMYYRHISKMRNGDNCPKPRPLSPSQKREIEFTGKLREEQTNVARETGSYLIKEGGCILAARPGFGKTVISTYLSSILGAKTLVLMSIGIVVDSWKNTFSSMTKSKIYVVGEKNINTFEDSDIIICMEQRLCKLESAQRLSIGLVIIDEAHLFCTKLRLSILFGLFPRYILACTATPWKADGTFKAMEIFTGNNIVWKKEVQPFKVYNFITGYSPETKVNMMGELDWNHLTDSLTKIKERNEDALQFIQRISDKRFLVLTNRVSHAKDIHKSLVDLGIDSDILAGNKKSFNFCRALVGTVSKIGTGFDEDKACLDKVIEKIEVMIVLSSTKNQTIVEQSAGRVFRHSSPSIIYFNDSLPVFRRHWNEAKKWYKSRDGTIVEDMTKDDIIKDLGGN